MSLLEIKSFVSLKNESLLLWTRVHFKGGGSQFLQNFEGFAHKRGGGRVGGGSDRFIIFFFEGGWQDKKSGCEYFRVGLIPWRTLWRLSMKVLQFLWNFHHFHYCISWKFSFIPIANQFLWQFEIFDFFVKIAKSEFGPILEGNFWKIELLEASSLNFPWISPESVPESAKIISWTFGIKKNISFEISKKC